MSGAIITDWRYDDMKIYVEGNRFGHYVVSNDENDETRYFQVDYDYCGLASTFGWTPCEECRETDGTVPCKHNKISDMIQSAIEYLDGYPAPVEDPGYFDA